MNIDQDRLKVAVIGAGLAGLCTLKYFVEDKNNYEVIAFEQAPELGGIWKYPEGCEEKRDVPANSPHYARTYRDLKTNTPNVLTEFQDFPFPKNSSGPSFSDRSQVLDYLFSYAEAFGLIPHIKFRHEVIEIKPLNDQHQHRRFTRWAVTETDLESGETEEHIFDAVVICNGHYHKPHLPDHFPGLDVFQGSVIHSSIYRIPEDYKGKNVLIVGGRSSSCDIACELASHAQKVIISRHKAEEILKPVFPNIIETSDVWTLTERGVILENGIKEDIDDIIFCTGYEHYCPFLHPDCQLEVSRGRIFPLYRHIISCHHPSLAFMAVYIFAIFSPVLEYQVRYFKAVLDGKLLLPMEDVMIDDTLADFKERKLEGQPEHHAHKMDNRLWPYIDQLASELGIPSYQPVIRKMYETLGPILFKKPYEIKKYRVIKLDSENFKHELMRED